jgi:adenylate cyclase
MSFEIERKFLVCDGGWQELAADRTSIRQAYLASEQRASIRVRIKSDSTATLTVKSRPHELRRLELEYAVPVLEAEALMPLRVGSVIEKVRYAVPWGDLVWEIDVFSGENAGLTIAEIELRHEHQRFELPGWIGTEITGQSRYYNSALAQRPFGSWSHRDARPHRDTPVSMERLA